MQIFSIWLVTPSWTRPHGVCTVGDMLPLCCIERNAFLINI